MRDEQKYLPGIIMSTTNIHFVFVAVSLTHIEQKSDMGVLYFYSRSMFSSLRS